MFSIVFIVLKNIFNEKISLKTDFFLSRKWYISKYIS